jgi:N-acetylmuramoyl-L-alanine amidase
MRLYQCLLTENPCFQTGRSIEPTGIMLHSTGANNPHLRRYVQPDDGRLGVNQSGSHWNRRDVQVCVHAFIGRLADGSVASYQTLPWKHRGWHCGVGSSGRSGNNSHISIEICEDDLQDAVYFSAVYREAVALCAHLCKLYGFDPLADGALICHSEGHRRGIASNHADVMHWFPMYGKSMDGFRSDVAALLKEEEAMTKEAFAALLQACEAERAAAEPALWSEASRAWAEGLGLVQGDGSAMNYGAALTREMAVVLLHRMWLLMERQMEA